MKLLVAVKRVIDFNVKPRVKADGTGVDLANVKMSMNPFDEIAVEEAIRLKEKGVATEIVAVSIGPAKAQETLRTALAMGADRAILIQTDDEVEPLAVAKLLAKVAEEEQPGLVILGKQAIDDDSATRPARCSPPCSAGAQGTFASKVEVDGDKVERHPRGRRRARDGEAQRCRRWSPPTFASTSRATPRLPNIMKAKSKPLAQKTPADYGVDTAPRLTTLKVVEPPSARPASRSARSTS